MQKKCQWLQSSNPNKKTKLVQWHPTALNIFCLKWKVLRTLNLQIILYDIVSYLAYFTHISRYSSESLWNLFFSKISFFFLLQTFNSSCQVYGFLKLITWWKLSCSFAFHWILLITNDKHCSYWFYSREKNYRKSGEKLFILSNVWESLKIELWRAVVKCVS